MKIIIVGAGPTGLATYLSLRKYVPGAEIVVYERHAPLPNVDHMSHGHNHQNEANGPAQATAGGGVGVAANGMRALYALSPKIYSQVIRDGWETMFMEMRTSGGWRLGYFPAHSTAPEDEIEQSLKCGTRRDGHTDKLGMVMISREALWRVLYAAVRQEERSRLVHIVHQGVNIKRVDAAEGIIEFGDGALERADLIIGADGINSLCRKSVVDPGEPGRDAQFEGLMSIGGFMPTVPKKCEEAKHNCAEKKRSMCRKNPSAVLVFGRRGFFGYSPCTMCISNSTTQASVRGPGPTSFWWATYSADAPETKTNEMSVAEGTARVQSRMLGYTESRVKRVLADLKLDEAAQPRKDSSDESDDSMIKPLSRRRTSIKWRDDPSVPPHAKVTVTTPTWILPPPPRWSRGRVILVGDAAHGLPSTSGQGISQALEDAVALGVLVSKTVSLADANSAAATPSATDSDAGPDEDVDPEKAMLHGDQTGLTIAAVAALGSRYEAFRRPRVEKILEKALQMQEAKEDKSFVQLMLTYAFLWMMLKFLPADAEEWKLGFDVEREAMKLSI